MKMDIGFGDVVMPEPLLITYPALMEELPAVTVWAYSLESVVAEKFQAMIELSEANSRYKDFYDVYKIFKNQKLTHDALSAVFMQRSGIGEPFILNHIRYSRKNLRQVKNGADNGCVS
jgi:hypothetical protein